MDTARTDDGNGQRLVFGQDGARRRWYAEGRTWTCSVSPAAAYEWT